MNSLSHDVDIRFFLRDIWSPGGRRRILMDDLGFRYLDFLLSSMIMVRIIYSIFFIRILRIGLWDSSK